MPPQGFSSATCAFAEWVARLVLEVWTLGVVFPAHQRKLGPQRWSQDCWRWENLGSHSQVGSTGVPFEFLNHTYVADYFLKGHCFPGSKHLHKSDMPLQSGPYDCPGLKEQNAGQRAGYNIGE